MTGPNSSRELEALIARTKKNRLQIQSVWERFENLEAAIESAKESQKKTESLVSAGRKKRMRRADRSPNHEIQARLLGNHMKRGITVKEVDALIKATEEGRRRLDMAWQNLEDLRGAIDASQEAQMQRQNRRLHSVSSSKSKSKRPK